MGTQTVFYFFKLFKNVFTSKPGTQLGMAKLSPSMNTLMTS